MPGIGVFRHLSPAFDVTDADGAPVARLVDDITLTADLEGTRSRPGHRGWYRILCDEPRLTRLIERQVDPLAPLTTVLEPIAALFGSVVEPLGPGARVNDPTGATLAVVLPLPPGRERPCEVITPPIAADHAARLEALLAPARNLGFTVPQEAAVHLHVDGAPFRRPEPFANLVRLFAHWRPLLWAALGTNPACRRLAPLPPALVELVDDLAPGSDDDADARWAELQTAARTLGLTKYADVNLTQLVVARPLRDTVEVRLLPGSIDGHEVVRQAALVEALLLRCLDPGPVRAPDDDAARDPWSALVALAGEHVATGAER